MVSLEGKLTYNYHNLNQNTNNVIILFLKVLMMLASGQIKVEEGMDIAKIQMENTDGPFKITRKQPILEEERLKKGEWTQLENAKYAAFIQENASRIRDKPHGKLWIVHHEMAEFIKTRNFRQCKLYHQRLSNKIGSIQKIISNFCVIYPEFQISLARQKLKVPNKLSKNTEKKTQPSICEEFIKKNNEDCIPTDIAYREDENMAGEGLKNPQMIPRFPQNFYNHGPLMRNNFKEHQWRQCHHLFLQWATRLVDLMHPQ